MQRLLTTEHDELLRRERSLLEELRVYLARLDAAEDDIDLLKQTLEQLDEFFLLVVVGEFNAGKTAFLNALLGERLLQEGVTPTTDQIQLLRHGDEIRYEPLMHEMVAVDIPVEWLREVNLVDTPGTNAVIKRHQQITEHFVPRSDLVLFITSVERPFSESERTFLESIRRWGKKIVIVINKIDLLQSDEEFEQIIDFVRDNAQQLLDVEPQIFPISARLALQAKQKGVEDAPDTWEASRFGALERYMLESLDATERLRLKLENPLGVASHLVEKYNGVIADRKHLLNDDFRTLDTIDEQLSAYQEDMMRDFQYHSSRIENILYEMIERGDAFFDKNLRMLNIPSLMNSDKLRADFEREVVADTSVRIERHVNDMIDWIVDKDYRQWRDIMDYLGRRSMQHSDRIVGQVQSEFDMNREKLLESIGRKARTVVNNYDRESESNKMAADVQRALIQTAAVEVGALGLGTLLVALLHTTLLDVTGIIGASVVAALGLYVLPHRRSKIKQELRASVNELQDELTTTIGRQFELELEDSVQRVREAVAPYTRFVRVEREKLEKLSDELKNTNDSIGRLRSDVRTVL